MTNLESTAPTMYKTLVRRQRNNNKNHKPSKQLWGENKQETVSGRKWHPLAAEDAGRMRNNIVL